MEQKCYICGNYIKEPDLRSTDWKPPSYQMHSYIRLENYDCSGRMICVCKDCLANIESEIEKLRECRIETAKYLEEHTGFKKNQQNIDTNKPLTLVDYARRAHKEIPVEIIKQKASEALVRRKKQTEMEESVRISQDFAHGGIYDFKNEYSGSWKFPPEEIQEMIVDFESKKDFEQIAREYEEDHHEQINKNLWFDTETGEEKSVLTELPSVQWKELKDFDVNEIDDVLASVKFEPLGDPDKNINLDDWDGDVDQTDKQSSQDDPLKRKERFMNYIKSKLVTIIHDQITNTLMKDFMEGGYDKLKESMYREFVKRSFHFEKQEYWKLKEAIDNNKI